MLRFLISLLILTVSAAGCRYEDKTPYELRLFRHRQSLDSFLRYSTKTPIPQDHKYTFLKLDYFDIDSAYRLTADIRRYELGDTIVMTKHIRGKTTYRRTAKLTFALNGQKHQLYAYEKARDPEINRTLYIPFRDATNGKTTEEDGRILEVPDFGEDSVVLDFNYARNIPYAYSPRQYNDPIPPKENTIDMAVRAGEKKYEP